MHLRALDGVILDLVAVGVVLVQPADRYAPQGVIRVSDRVRRHSIRCYIAAFRFVAFAVTHEHDTAVVRLHPSGRFQIALGERYLGHGGRRGIGRQGACAATCVTTLRRVRFYYLPPVVVQHLYDRRLGIYIILRQVHHRVHVQIDIRAEGVVLGECVAPLLVPGDQFGIPAGVGDGQGLFVLRVEITAVPGIGVSATVLPNVRIVAPAVARLEV